MAGRRRVNPVPPGGIELRGDNPEDLAQVFERMGMPAERAQALAAHTMASMRGGGGGPSADGRFGPSYEARGLRLAAAWGDTAKARQLLADGEDVNRHEGDGEAVAAARRPACVRPPPALQRPHCRRLPGKLPLPPQERSAPPLPPP